MTLSSEHLKLLSDWFDDEQSTFDSLLSQLYKNFSSNGDQFSLAIVISNILLDELLLTSQNRFIASFLLADLYKAKSIIYSMNVQQITEWSKSLEPVQINLLDLVEEHRKLTPPLGSFEQSGLTAHLNLKEEFENGEPVNIEKSHYWVENHVSLTQLPTLHPVTLRPQPYILEPYKDDAVWLFPGIPIGPPTSFITQNTTTGTTSKNVNSPAIGPKSIAFQSLWFEWDTNMGALPANEQGEAILLLNQALTTTLTSTQFTKLITELRASPEILKDSNLSPKTLENLVELNPKVATQCLVELSQGVPENEITLFSDYWTTLANLPMSKNSMEVISSVSYVLDLPSEYLHTYISNCIRYCHSIKEVLPQHRAVAICSVFLQTLIFKRILKEDTIFSEIEHFCVSFSRVTEAATLFRTLKQHQ